MTRYAEIEKAAQGVLDYFEEYFPTVLDPLRAALALPEDSKTVNAIPPTYTVKRAWPEWLGINSLPKSGPVLIVHENDSGDRWITEWEASRYHAERLKEAQHNFPPHLVWAKAINWMPSPPLPGEVTLVFCNTCGHPSNANDVSTTRVVNAELYGLAVALADSAARSDIECLCVRTGADRRTYTTDAVRNADKPEVAMAARYLSLREQSGEPLPYKVVRDGDKVRFE